MYLFNFSSMTCCFNFSSTCVLLVTVSLSIYLTTGKTEQAIIWSSVWINWHADDSLKILLAAYDPCWAMQHLGLHWLKDRDSCRKTKHGVFCMTVSYLTCSGTETTLCTLIFPEDGSSLVCLVVPMEPFLNILDDLSSGVHLEKITPTLTNIFVGSFVYEDLCSLNLEKLKCSVFRML